MKGNAIGNSKLLHGIFKFFCAASRQFYYIHIRHQDPKDSLNKMVFFDLNLKFAWSRFPSVVRHEHLFGLSLWRSDKHLFYKSSSEGASSISQRLFGKASIETARFGQFHLSVRLMAAHVKIFKWTVLAPIRSKKNFSILLKW